MFRYLLFSVCVGQPSYAAPAASFANPDVWLRAFVRNHVSIISKAVANPRGYLIDWHAPVRCIADRGAQALRGVCILHGSLENQPNSATTFALVMPTTFPLEAIRMSDMIPITGEDVEPVNGHATGSLETFLIDGGGEDIAIQALERVGLLVDQIFGYGEPNMRCLSLRDDSPLGACLLRVIAGRASRRVVIVVSETDGGENTHVSVFKVG